MNSKITLIIVLFLSMLLSCKESKEASFNKEGISVTCPKGWNISDEENFDNAGYYLWIEKDGLDSSGLVTLTWLNNEMDLDEWMTIYKDEMKGNIIYKNSNLEFSEQYQGKYNTFSTQAIKFTATIVGIKHEGEIQVFHEKRKTFSVMKQEAIEDNSENAPGFKIIEDSFMVK